MVSFDADTRYLTTSRLSIAARDVLRDVHDLAQGDRRDRCDRIVAHAQATAIPCLAGCPANAISRPHHACTTSRHHRAGRESCHRPCGHVEGCRSCDGTILRRPHGRASAAAAAALPVGTSAMAHAGAQVDPAADLAVALAARPAQSADPAPAARPGNQLAP